MNHVILIDTADRKGLIHYVTGVLLSYNMNIISNGEYADPKTGRFFMRSEVVGEVDAQQLHRDLTKALPEDSQLRIVSGKTKRVVLLVTKESHCLGDLLIRYRAGEFNIEIPAIIGNRENLRDLAEKFEIPFHCVSHEGIDRQTHETRVMEQVDQYNPDYLVLAKYMRILSPEFVAHYLSRMINIHHSFLPAFIGANPYKQAYERGVKIIGATAHFVTEQLDEGPIIAQGVTSVDHTHGVKDMRLAGRDVEKTVLAKALKLVFADRVFVQGNKTIIFN